VVGPEWQAELAGDGVPAGRMLDAAAGRAKRFASGVPFEVDAQ